MAAMPNLSTTKMTSKGQVVIPEEIREYMHLEVGERFIVMAYNDSIIFKKIMPISPQRIERLFKSTQEMAKKYKFKEKDISKVITEVRASPKNSKAKKA